MKKQKQVKVSQCMIVKNEEKNIEQALSWGKKIMAEQIVVDTGSTDRTVEIAQRMGAKVYYFQWIDDFSAAKNYAISKARYEWIAFLDADEYMTPEETAKLPEVLRQLSAGRFDGLSTGWQQLNDKGEIFSSGTQVRFFRNRSDIRYRRRIHEQLVSTEGKELRIGDGVKDLSIFHTGYQKDALNKKSGRNRRLIQEELDQNPEDYEMMGYMGDDYAAEGEKKEAIQWYRKAICHMPNQLPSYDQRSAATFSSLLTFLTEEAEASWEEVYQQAVEKLPEEADFDYVVGRFFAVQGQAGQAVRYLEAALAKLETYGCNNKALLLAGNLLDAYELLARCCYDAGEMQKGVTYGVNYLKYNRYGIAVLSRLLKVLLAGEGQQNQAVLDFLARLYDVSSLKDRLFIVKAAEIAECHDFARFAEGILFTPEEKTALGFTL